MEKIKVTIAGIGTVDECDHCHTEHTKGVACWQLDGFISLNLCNVCLENYYEHDLNAIRNFKDSVYHCKVCKDTGIMKYKDITPMTDYSWVPWSEKECTHCDRNKLVAKDILQHDNNAPSYPGRIYGMYKWDGDRWVIDKEFCLKNSIDID